VSKNESGEQSELNLAHRRTNLSWQRTFLANDRTFSAWIRTGLSLEVAGLGVVRFLGEMNATLTLLIGEIFIVVSAGVYILGLLRYLSMWEDIRDQVDRSTRPFMLVAGGLTLTSILAFILLLFFS
jgi:putative membrane protein